jgi:outer membrane protein insertion porin family
VVDPGRRVYVRRIAVTGNTKTRDEVVRREMRQLEGAFYDASRIQLSRRRIDRTAYFSEVNVETQPVEGSPDQIDVVYTVKEKPTGAFLIGAGFSSTERLVLQASIQQTNVFGSGKYLNAAVSSGRINQVYSLSYTDPYFTVDGVSQGFDAYKRRTNASSLVVGNYTTDALGGGVRWGYPVSETATFSLGLNYETVKLETFADSPQQYLDFARIFGNDYRYLTGTAGYRVDTRDSVIVTRSGSLQRLSGELAGGDLQFYRLGYQHQWYLPVGRDSALSLRGELGYADGLGEKPLPFFKNYYLGGPDSVRGYSPYSLGPRDVNSRSLGGNRKFNGSLELHFPMPGAAKEQALRLAAFVDFGQVYGAREKFDLQDLRYSAGLGLNWASPFGPLRLSFGIPLNRQPGDSIQRLQFTFGNVF